LAVLPGPVIAEAMELLEKYERFHRLKAELAQQAMSRLLNAWRHVPGGVA
jgi:hypothetical protein